MRKRDSDSNESTHLLGTSAPSRVHYYEDNIDYDDGNVEQQCYREKTVNPSIGRRYSLAVPNPRIRSNSIAIYNDDEEDVVFTSYGPVILEPTRNARRDWMLGGFLAILSGILFTAGNFFVKYFTIDAIEMLMIRSLLQVVIMALVIVITKRKFFPEKKLDKILVIVQGILGGAKNLVQFACVVYMPIGDALTIIFTEPLWTLVLSKFILKIRIGWWKMLFGFLLLAGMILCIQPPFLFPVGPDQPSNTSADDTHANVTNLMHSMVTQIRQSLHEEPEDLTDEEPGASRYYVGCLLAVLTGVFGAANNVVIARCEKVSSKVMVFYAGLGGLIISFICSSFDADNKIIYNITAISSNQWLVLTLLGLMGIIGHFCMTRSLRLIPPTTVAVLRAMEIILAYVAQALVMGEIPNALSITGSSFVMLSVVAFALEEMIFGWFQRRQDEDL